MNRQEIQEIIKENEVLLERTSLEVKYAIMRLQEALYYIQSIRSPESSFNENEVTDFALRLHDVLDHYGLGTTGLRDDIRNLICTFGRDLNNELPF